ncbi:cell wall hydrolase [Niallia sp. Krafla_26]|uniref:cell wall hydrolase n=1 Tax=Niallia sp. Krafla_26 TaxID=3064703 RepID=UPI003D163E84
MKKIKTALLTFVTTLTLFSFQSTSEASSTHVVKAGESLWKIGNHYGVPVQAIKRLNNQSANMVYAGQSLAIPQSISTAEKDLLARLVSAEAKGESYAGKVAVATVVLNRVDHPDFPDTVKDVIYQIDGGHYAFTPVQNEEINKAADTASVKAVNEALAFRGQGNGSLYFYNPNTSTSKWILSRQPTVKIGNHVFAK